MKKLAVLGLWAAACSAPAQQTKKEAPAAAPPAASAPVPPPEGPQPMSREGFKDFVRAVDQEAGDQAKLDLIRSAAAHNWFTAAMAGVLIDHIVYRENKLAAVPLLKERIL